MSDNNNLKDATNEKKTRLYYWFIDGVNGLF